MVTNPSLLQILLTGAAATQMAVAVLNLGLVRFLHWKAELDRLPLLLRQVFMVHVWFISLALATFAVLTGRFAAEMASGANPLAAWLAGAIGLFWGIRTLVQIAYYSRSHWQGHRGRTFIHAVFLVVYGGMTVIYLVAATRA
jgi:hypothetical protein